MEEQMEKPKVGIVMGSDSDLSTMGEATKILDHFGISYEVTVSSAHRSPQRTSDYARSAIKRGLCVIIVGAGGAAHLAGVIASETTLPVIGVPIDSTSLSGLDSLLSTVQMPSGVPVATMAIGKAGARNAGILASQILALKSPSLKKRLDTYRKTLARQVEAKAKKVEKSHS